MDKLLDILGQVILWASAVSCLLIYFLCWYCDVRGGPRD